MDKLCGLDKNISNFPEPIGKGAKRYQEEQNSGTEKQIERNKCPILYLYLGNESNYIFI